VWVFGVGLVGSLRPRARAVAFGNPQTRKVVPVDARSRHSLFAVAATTLANAASCHTQVIGADLALHAPHFTVAAPSRSLAVSLPYDSAAWEVSALGSDAIVLRTLRDATVRDGSRSIHAPPMSCVFALAPAGQSFDQTVTGWHPESLRYNERTVDTPRARVFTAMRPPSGPDRRVGIVELSSGRVAVGACMLIGASSPDGTETASDPGGRARAGAESFAFYDDILLSVTDDRARFPNAQLQATVDGALILREHHRIPLTGAAFSRGLSLGMPGPAGLWTSYPQPAGFLLRADARRLGTSVRCLVANYPARSPDEAVRTITHDRQGAPRGTFLTERREVTVGEHQGVSSSLVDDQSGEDMIAWATPLSNGQLLVACYGHNLDDAHEVFDVALARSVLIPPPETTAPPRPPLTPPEPPPDTPRAPATPDQPMLEIAPPTPSTSQPPRERRRRRPRRGGARRTH
jgi:hypothetical protein